MDHFLLLLLRGATSLLDLDSQLFRIVGVTGDRLCRVESVFDGDLGLHTRPIRDLLYVEGL